MTTLRPETVRQIKQDIAYQPRCRNCGTCAHRKEVADSQVDRSWIIVCDLLDIGTFPTTDAAVCNHWKETTSPCG